MLFWMSNRFSYFGNSKLSWGHEMKQLRSIYCCCNMYKPCVHFGYGTGFILAFLDTILLNMWTTHKCLFWKIKHYFLFLIIFHTVTKLNVHTYVKVQCRRTFLFGLQCGPMYQGCPAFPDVPSVLVSCPELC